MEALVLFSIVFYLLSTVGYFGFLFLQKDRWQKLGYYALLVGFVIHTAAIATAFVQSGHMPVGNLHQTLSFAAWAVAGVFLAFQFKYRLKVLGVYAAPFIAFIMAIASQIPSAPAEATQTLRSFWLILHVTVIFIGEAGFALACGLGILYLLQENAIKTKKQRFFFKRLPSLDRLDSSGYTCMVIGFTMLTLGLITGFVYAKSIWGRFWSWDPKEVWSGIIWLFYAVLLHQRLTAGWRGRRSAIMAIIGFAVLVFTFLGVNLLMEGHHRPFAN
jgi:cytochrome c-type biogenesis protein CcsB